MNDYEILMVLKPCQVARLRLLSRGLGLNVLVQQIVDAFLDAHDAARQVAADAECVESASATVCEYERIYDLDRRDIVEIWGGHDAQRSG